MLNLRSLVLKLSEKLSLSDMVVSFLTKLLRVALPEFIICHKYIQRKR